MTTGYLWTKALHIVFMTSWFAGLFYLPRIYVNLALAAAGGDTSGTPSPEVARLLVMARKLYRFMTPLGLIALGLGLILWLYYGIGRGAGWMHAKLAIVLLLVVYHGACGALLKAFEAGRNRRSHRWFRFFNEVPVLALLATVLLVVLKPF